MYNFVIDYKLKSKNILFSINFYTFGGYKYITLLFNVLIE